MPGKKTTDEPTESSALLSALVVFNKTARFQYKIEENLWVWCDYCNKPRHT